MRQIGVIMDRWDDNESKDYERAISSLKGLEMEVSPYMKTRVLATARPPQVKKTPWLLVFSVLSTVALLVMVSLQVVKGPVSSGKSVGEAYLVKADLRGVHNQEPAFVKIELVGEVEFASKKFRQIKEMRSLTLSWEKLAGKQYLPIVVRGKEEGASKVQIRFYDKNNKVIKSEDFDFDFEDGRSA